MDPEHLQGENKHFSTVAGNLQILQQAPSSPSKSSVPSSISKQRLSVKRTSGVEHWFRTCETKFQVSLLKKQMILCRGLVNGVRASLSYTHLHFLGF